MRLQPRDFEILSEVYRWGFLCGRHVRFLSGFTGQRATDRRLKILVDSGYLTYTKLFYGTAGFYQLSSKGYSILGHRARPSKVRAEQYAHDILVVDTAIFIMDTLQVAPKDITTTKELHSLSGFSTRKHCPDFVFVKSGKKCCVEVELSHKAKDRLLANIQKNYEEYDAQLWVLPAHDKRNGNIISLSGFNYIKIIESDVISHYIKERQ